MCTKDNRDIYARIMCNICFIISLILVFIFGRIYGKIYYNHYRNDIKADLHSKDEEIGFNKSNIWLLDNDVTISQYPYMAQISRRYAMDIFAFCGGTLITRTHVLTAGHCVSEGNKIVTVDSLQVRLGTSYFGIGGITSAIKTIIRHPNYKSVRNYATFNIAILELEDYMPLSKVIMPVKLATGVDTMNLMQLVREESQCFLAGWGQTGTNISMTVPNNMTIRLTTFSMNLTDWMACKRKDNTLNRRIEACTTFPASGNICVGNSGGPVMCGDNRQYGVITHRSGCGSPLKPDIFTRVDVLYGFIEDIIKASSLDNEKSTLPDSRNKNTLTNIN